MKKIIAIMLVAIFMIGASLNVSADEVIGNIYEIENTTVIFDENSQFSIEKQAVIAELLVHPEYGVSQANWLCSLFGHDNVTEGVTTITHRVNAESPRCLQEMFMVTSCKRCGESSTERTGYYFISCCPED